MIMYLKYVFITTTILNYYSQQDCGLFSVAALVLKPSSTGRYAVLVNAGARELINKLIPPAYKDNTNTQSSPGGRLTRHGVNGLFKVSKWLDQNFPLHNHEYELRTSNVTLNLASLKTLYVFLRACSERTNLINITHAPTMIRDKIRILDGFCCDLNDGNNQKISRLLNALYSPLSSSTAPSKGLNSVEDIQLSRLSQFVSISEIPYTIEMLHVLSLPLLTCGRVRNWTENLMADVVHNQLGLNRGILEALFVKNGYDRTAVGSNSAETKMIGSRFISIKDYFLHQISGAKTTGTLNDSGLEGWPELDWSNIFKNFNALTKKVTMSDELPIKQIVAGNLLKTLFEWFDDTPLNYNKGDRYNTNQLRESDDEKGKVRIYVVNDMHITASLALLGMNYTNPDVPSSFVFVEEIIPSSTSPISTISVGKNGASRIFNITYYGEDAKLKQRLTISQLDLQKISFKPRETSFKNGQEYQDYCRGR